MTKEPVYIIIPVHNRKAITLKCLETLENNGDLDQYHVIVVDDGSSDGTSSAIQSQYPDVIILQGDGNLWWTGAIKMGMEYAYQQGAEYFIWLNDDCYPQKEAISQLVNLCQSNPKIIAGGQCFDPDTLEPSYGGIAIKKYEVINIYDKQKILLECDGLAGNLICIYKQVIDTIGYPNSFLFPQYYGDVIYTNVAKKMGYKLMVFQKSIALCKNDHPRISWLNPDKPLLTYWQDYFQIKSSSYWKAELNYYRELFGFQGILLYVYKKIVRFWLFFIFVTITPPSFRQSLKQIKQ
ncbi:MAG: glycosyltransferase family 2 protein [Microcystis wesenbergii TW10]|jgi:GT2 family glycosyltransferase|uniref:Glycosyltransferase family 2 protein n=2 Tax=Microcystis TaxID=1125 RepID=A0A552AES3_MICAE|nr:MULTISPECIES: glycosyltransferase family 2 protein [unclassified Microcystis]MCZ8100194.1 glycosyltransferase family 2 protein [Burkholderiales bacterium]REJ56084.1 MAG: glycosyltransferase family 2 protein [Microcystis wesenbergii TW10]TRT83963.1 MAG: glycosyltransferase family 2 protein [Microcystis aeruginosa Ma_OC_H_19870700_S124]MCZ8038601.1 glycosyltransferase family 2 protein [Microcystis sp. LE17-20A]MCZ8214498.1 glycosyltransferase family 2 protein [Microcystis sp. LE19-8.1F]